MVGVGVEVEGRVVGRDKGLLLLLPFPHGLRLRRESPLTGTARRNGVRVHGACMRAGYYIMG